MARRPQLTGRAAILAVVVCAIAMSLAYPIREYVAQRRQIAELEAEKADQLRKLGKLVERRKQLNDPEYVMQQAKRRLHMCEPDAKCYVVLEDTSGQATAKTAAKDAGQAPWYLTLWESVQAADSGKGVTASG